MSLQTNSMGSNLGLGGLLKANAMFHPYSSLNNVFDSQSSSLLYAVMLGVIILEWLYVRPVQLLKYAGKTMQELPLCLWAWKTVVRSHVSSAWGRVAYRLQGASYLIGFDIILYCGLLSTSSLFYFFHTWLCLRFRMKQTLTLSVFAFLVKDLNLLLGSGYVRWKEGLPHGIRSVGRVRY